MPIFDSPVAAIKGKLQAFGLCFSLEEHLFTGNLLAIPFNFKGFSQSLFAGCNSVNLCNFCIDFAVVLGTSSGCKYKAATGRTVSNEGATFSFFRGS